LEESLKRIFLMAFDILFLILFIAAVFYGPGGYKEYLRASEDAARGTACAELAAVLRDNLQKLDELENQYQFGGQNYSWRVRVFVLDLQTGERTLLRSAGQPPASETISVQAYAIPVENNGRMLVGVLEVAVW